MTASPTHELFHFMQQAALQMQNDYEQARRIANDDPGTAGDAGEEHWAKVLRDWLPTGYSVETKGRLLDAQGNLTPQVDVIVLRPSYPPRLRNTKIFLASGVAAAFECKLTLKTAHLDQAAAQAVAVKKATPPNFGSPFKELRSSPIFGLLAHTHSWKSDTSTPIENVAHALREADIRHCWHPRYALDLVCISDLGTWRGVWMPGLGPQYTGSDWTTAREEHGLPADGGVLTGYLGPIALKGDVRARPNALGVMFSWLLRLLAWEDEAIRPISRYFNIAGLLGPAQGRTRPWPWEVYSERVRALVLKGALREGDLWDEWRDAVARP